MRARFEPAASEPLEVVAGGVRRCTDEAICPPHSFGWKTGLPAVLVDGHDRVEFQGVVEDDAGIRCWIAFHAWTVVGDEASAGAVLGPEAPSAAAHRATSGYVSGEGYLPLDPSLAPYDPCYWDLNVWDGRLNATFTTDVAS